MTTLKDFFNNNGGYAHMKELRNASFQTRFIKEKLADGTIEKVKPGLYRLAEVSLHGGSDYQMVDICAAYPKAVICLSSALSFYELTTFLPKQIDIAIPNNYQAPKIDYPPLRVYYFRERTYSEGIVELTRENGVLRIYSPERTICDMFRFRNRFGSDIAVEGLKNYMRQPKPNVNRIFHYSKVCRVSNVMRPYLETLVS